MQIAGAEIVHADDAPDLGAVGRDRRKPDQVGMVERPLLGGRELRARDVEVGAGDALRRRCGR